jgi:hypothetical protein
VENVSQIEMADQGNLLRTTPTSLGMSQMDPATQIMHGPPAHNDFCPKQAATEEIGEVPSHFADFFFQKKAGALPFIKIEEKQI